jgi:hypothetical protein
MLPLVSSPLKQHGQMIRNLVGSIYKEYSFHSNSINKHGHHRQFLFLIGLFLKIFSSETTCHVVSEEKKQESPVVAMFFNGSGWNEQSL